MMTDRYPARKKLLTAVLLPTLCAALLAQSAAPVVSGAHPAPLDPAALEKKVDELLDAHAKINGFSGTVLLASEGKPLVAKGYGYANVEWQIPNTTKTKFRIGSMLGLIAGYAAAGQSFGEDVYVDVHRGGHI